MDCFDCHNRRPKKKKKKKSFRAAPDKAPLISPQPVQLDRSLPMAKQRAVGLTPLH